MDNKYPPISNACQQSHDQAAAFIASTRMLLNMNLPGDTIEINGNNYYILEVKEDGSITYRANTPTRTYVAPATECKIINPMDHLKLTNELRLLTCNTVSSIDSNGNFFINNRPIIPVYNKEGKPIMLIAASMPFPKEYRVSSITMTVFGLQHADILVYAVTQSIMDENPIIEIKDGNNTATTKPITIQGGTSFLVYFRRREGTANNLVSKCTGVRMSAIFERLPGNIVGLNEVHGDVFTSIWTSLVNGNMLSINKTHLVIDTPHMKRLFQVEETESMTQRDLIKDFNTIVLRSGISQLVASRVFKMLKTILDDLDLNMSIPIHIRKYQYSTMRRAFHDMFDVFLHDQTKVELVFTDLASVVDNCLDGWKGTITRMHSYVINDTSKLAIFEEELNIRDLFLRVLHNARCDDVDKFMHRIKTNMIPNTSDPISEMANIHLENYIISQVNFGIIKEIDANQDIHKSMYNDLKLESVRNELFDNYTPERILRLFHENILIGRGSQARREECYNLLCANIPHGFPVLPNESTLDRQIRWLYHCHDPTGIALSDAACRYILILMKILQFNLMEFMQTECVIPGVTYDWAKHLVQKEGSARGNRYVCIKTWTPRPDFAMANGLLSVRSGDHVLVDWKEFNDGRTEGWVYGSIEDDPARHGLIDHAVLREYDLRPISYPVNTILTVKQEYISQQIGYLTVSPGDCVKVTYKIENPGVWVFVERITPNPGTGWISTYCLEDGWVSPHELKSE